MSLIPEDLTAFALRLSQQQPQLTYDGIEGPPPLAVWLGRLYGYTYTHTVWEDVHVRYGRGGFTMYFVRDDGPESRRRAAWMINPGSDPAFRPPVTWRTDGSPGIHPATWHPAVRLNDPPPEEVAMIQSVLAQSQQSGDRATGQVAAHPVGRAVLYFLVLLVLALGLFAAEGHGHLDGTDVAVAVLAAALLGLAPLSRVGVRNRRARKAAEATRTGGGWQR